MHMKKVLVVILALIVVASLIDVFFLRKQQRVISKNPAASGVNDQAQDQSLVPTGWLVYKNTDPAFSLAYPEGVTVDSQNVYGSLGPNKEIRGVKFTIPHAITEGTNLSQDTGLIVQIMPNTRCSVSDFVDLSAVINNSSTGDSTVAVNGTIYQVVQTSDAGAGNYYEETVYVDTGRCVAVRYFIHSTNIGNYDPGTVQEFDKEAVVSLFDSIFRTLEIK